MPATSPAYADTFRDDLLSWGSENYRSYPWRDPSRSLYQVFIAEFFLTQTPADNVADVYPTFLERFPSLRAIDEADRQEVRETIEPLGFHRMRTDALKSIAEKYDSLPRERDELVALPRVGPYVADATLCFALERALPILDRNVVRVYDRVFGSAFPERESQQHAFAAELLPEDGAEARRYNLALLDLGATICGKLEPKCEQCFATDYCTYYESLDGTD